MSQWVNGWGTKKHAHDSACFLSTGPASCWIIDSTTLDSVTLLCCVHFGWAVFRSNNCHFKIIREIHTYKYWESEMEYILIVLTLSCLMLTVLCPERRASFLLIIWWLVSGAHRYRRTLNTCAISLWAANCSLTQLLFNHGYLLNGGNTKNNWHNTCGAQIGLSTGSDATITDTGYCSTWRENERWQVQTNTIPCTTEDHQLFKKIWIHASRHLVTINIDSKEETVKFWMGRGQQVTDVCYNHSEL